MQVFLFLFFHFSLSTPLFFSSGSSVKAGNVSELKAFFALSSGRLTLTARHTLKSAPPPPPAKTTRNTFFPLRILLS